MCIKTNKVGKQEVGIWWVQKRFPRYGVPIWSLWPNIRFLHHIVGSVFGPVRFLLPVCRLSWFLYTLNIYAHFSSHFSQQLLMAEIWYFCELMLTYDTPALWQTGSRNLTGPKTLPTIWGTFRFPLPVCRLRWFLCILNIHFVYAHF
jgi:hypothetical protein